MYMYLCVYLHTYVSIHVFLYVNMYFKIYIDHSHALQFSQSHIQGEICNIYMYIFMWLCLYGSVRMYSCNYVRIYMNISIHHLLCSPAGVTYKIIYVCIYICHVCFIYIYISINLFYLSYLGQKVVMWN